MRPAGVSAAVKIFCTADSSAVARPALNDDITRDKPFYAKQFRENKAGINFLEVCAAAGMRAAEAAER